MAEGPVIRNAGIQEDRHIAEAMEAAREILSQIPEYDPETGAKVGDFSRYAANFFGDMDDPENVQIVNHALAHVQAMNPRTPSDAPIYRQSPWLLGLRNLGRGGFGNYSGGGWSPQERELFKQQKGRYPDGRDLSPGDEFVYGREQELATLQAIADSRQSLQAIDREVPDKYGARQFHRFVANNQMRQAVQNYRDSQGKQAGQAFTGTGSVYSKHQGWNAVGDAMTSHQSYIGNNMQKGQFTSDWASGAVLFPQGIDAAHQAAAVHEGRYHWDAPSPPYVPDGLNAGQRDAHIAKAQKLIAESVPPNYSLSYWRERGEPPSYASQLGAYLLGNMADLSTVGMLGAGKAVNMSAKALAKAGVPVASRYGAHIASKTAPIAAAKIGPFLAREGYEDGVMGSALTGVMVAGEPERPSFFFPTLRGLPSAWKPGYQNRPDLRAALMAENASPADWMKPGGVYDQKVQRAPQAAKELAAMNRESPNAFGSSTMIGRAGSALGEAVAGVPPLPPPPKEQPRYLPPVWNMLAR